MSVTRRDLLAVVGIAPIASAGCLSRGADEELEDHPAVGDPEAVPTLGPPPGDAQATVVAFEDPSCRSCATFAEGTFPELRDLATESELTYQWRGVPWVEAWGEPAIRALFAVWDDDAQRFWQLKRAYYDGQDRLDVDSVYAWTLERISEWSIDDEQISSAMDGEDDRVDRDEHAAEASGIEQVPAFVLFSAGSYVSTVVGAQPFDVFEGALEL